MKTFHEAPKSIFRDIQRLTDGDYALVHLMEKDKDYAAMFKKAVNSGREVILDNSLFELGSSFDPDVFANWIEELRPAYYVIPDVLENGEDNIALCEKFLSEHKDLPGKTMGVVHGKDYEDFKKCYTRMVDLCDKVCITLDSPWWHTQLVDGKNVYDSLGELTEEANRRWCSESAIGRPSTIWRLRDDGVLHPFKPHHLLGCYLPQEMMLYSQYSFIESVDTCNPVVWGLQHVLYPAGGPATKISTKMETLMDAEVNPYQLSDITYNILEFRRYCKQGGR